MTKLGQFHDCRIFIRFFRTAGPWYMSRCDQ